MKSKDKNLEKNISRLIKLTGDAAKPGEAFSDSLIEKAVDKLKAPGRGAWFRRPIWIGAAAAVVLLAGLTIFLADFAGDKTTTSEFAKAPSPPTDMKDSLLVAPKLKARTVAKISKPG